MVGLCQLTIARRLAWQTVEVDTETIRIRNLRTTTVDRSDVLAVGEETGREVSSGSGRSPEPGVQRRHGVRDPEQPGSFRLGGESTAANEVFPCQ